MRNERKNKSGQFFQLPKFKFTDQGGGYATEWFLGYLFFLLGDCSSNSMSFTSLWETAWSLLLSSAHIPSQFGGSLSSTCWFHCWQVISPETTLSRIINRAEFSPQLDPRCDIWLFGFCSPAPELGLRGNTLQWTGISREIIYHRASVFITNSNDSVIYLVSVLSTHKCM